jgi:bifunctional DNA-binding transcriptional regulator/antitoxin component of YhaV-PrlF toxin-antitoxin module
LSIPEKQGIIILAMHLQQGGFKMSAPTQGITRLTRKFQTSIPKKICRVKGLDPGDKELDEFAGIIKTTKSSADIMEELRGPRHENGR